ncbi:MAG: hypothetical protein C1943_02310 [Halochromatium sp.]|nr:hypothetical protein [Halochromatium sp.]
MKHELKCVKLKRRGAEYVAKLTAGMSMSEQLTFWQQRTEAMLRRQEQQHTLEFGHTEIVCEPSCR